MLNLKSELVHATLVWRETGQQVVLEPPSEAAASSATGQNKGYHLFLSHKWEHAQETASAIKAALRALVPSCRVFQDVDELDDVRKLESAVSNSDVVVVIVTDKYVRSPNCRRELKEAIRLRKPLVLLVECDPDKGATSVNLLRAELEMADRDGELTRQHEREPVLALIALLEQVRSPRDLPTRSHHARYP